MASRRSVLGAAALAVASGMVASGTAGCAGPTDALLGGGSAVRVAVSWSAAELTAFRSVLDRLGVRYDLIPLGDEIATAFSSHTARRPDVVMLPQPGLVKTLAERAEIEPLRDDAVSQPWPYAEMWHPMLCHEGRCYGLPFKIAHKSTVWYRKSVFAEHGLSRPRRWSDWLALNRTLSARGVAPLALPGADGWMLTDFFENVLLGTAPGVYDEFARAGPGARLSADDAVGAVTGALRLLGRMWADARLAGGVNRALVQQFPDAVAEVFGYRRAAMVVAPDFAEPLVRDFALPGDCGIFQFPALAGRGTPPLVAGGDVAVLRSGATQQARDLVRRLADPGAALPWITGRGGFLAAHTEAPLTGYTPELRVLAGQLNSNRASIRFDLSDQLGPLGGGGGLWRVLQDFLGQVGGRGAQADLPRAVDQAIRALRDFCAAPECGG